MGTLGVVTGIPVLFRTMIANCKFLWAVLQAVVSSSLLPPDLISHAGFARCIESPDAMKWAVLPNVSDTSAFVLGSLAGFGEMHNLLCAVHTIAAKYNNTIISLESLGSLLAIAEECKEEVDHDCGRVATLFAGLVALVAWEEEPFLVGLPSECRIAEAVKSKIGYVRSRPDV